MYKLCLALNDPQRLICHKTKNTTTINLYNSLLFCIFFCSGFTHFYRLNFFSLFGVFFFGRSNISIFCDYFICHCFPSFPFFCLLFFLSSSSSSTSSSSFSFAFSSFSSSSCLSRSYLSMATFLSAGPSIYIHKFLRSCGFVAFTLFFPTFS